MTERVRVVRSHRRAGPASAIVAPVAAAVLLAGPVGAVELRGFPVELGGRVTGSSPAVADLDGDGQLDVALCTATRLVVLDNAGAPLPGFPVVLSDAGEDSDVQNPASPAVCDVDGDGAPELVVAGPDRRLHLVGGDGVARPGWPVELSARAPAAPLCLDLDGDDRNEILVISESGVLEVRRASGEPHRGFKPPATKFAPSAITAVDLRPDRPGPELVLGAADGRLHALDRSGRDIPGFPVVTDYAVSAGAAAGDLDGDGRWDLVFGSQDFGLYAVRADGTPLAGFPVKTGYRLYGGPALGDLDGDGLPDIVIGGGDGKIYAVSGRGAPLPGWPVATRSRIHSTPALADLDRDGGLEVLVTSSDGRLYALTARGRAVPGFPVVVGGELTTSPLAVDLDRNGSIEVLVASGSGRLHAHTFAPVGPALATRVAWPGYAAGAARRGATAPNPGLYLELDLEPAQPRTADALRLRYRHVDLDGDPEQGTRIRWLRDGAPVPELDDQREVPPALTRKGQRWSCTVQAAEDHAVFGEGRGARRWRCPERRIGNTPPTAPEIRHEPLAPTTRDTIRLAVTTPATDPDGDKVSYRVHWLRERELVKALDGALTLPPGQTQKGQRWEAVVIAHDGSDEGVPVRHHIVVANAAPSVPEIRLNPASARAGDRVAVAISKPAVDADGDAVRYLYRWLVDGVARPLDPSVDAVVAHVAGKGHSLAVEVVASDGQIASAPARAELKVANTPPPAPVVTLVPAQPRSGDELIVRIAPEAADTDHDVVSHRLVWKRDGVVVPALVGPRVPAGQVRRGERWSVEVTPHDGEVAGSPARAEVVVGNRPSTAPRVTVSPAQPRAGDALKAQIVEPSIDPDGDAVRYTWSWLRDGTEVKGLAGDSVPPGRVKKNEVWRARATPDDGKERGPAGQADLRIDDTPPGAASVRIEPVAPVTADSLRVVIASPAVDVDGDAVAYRYTWFLDGVPQDLAGDGAELPAARTQKGQRWSVEAVAVADRALGPPARAEVAIGDTAPAAPRVVITPASPRTGDALHASVPELPADADGDPVRVAIRWLRDGQPAGVEGAVVAAERTRRGERWTAEAVADDGTRRSTPGRAEVVIANTPPGPPAIEVVRRQVTTDEPAEVRVRTPAADPDGDAVQLRTAWEWNGKVQDLPAGTLRLPPERTAKGEAWVLRLTPWDGTDAGRELRVAFDVVNTPPGRPSIRLTPAQPSTQDALQAVVEVPAPDVDRDRLSYRYRWFKDGVRQRVDENSGRLDAAATRRDEIWRVEVRAHDGEVEGPPASAEVRVRNSVPGSPVLAIEPERPRTGQALRCAVRTPAADADGDTLVYRFVWERDGAVVVEGVDGEIPGALVRRGQRWRCQAEALDGEAAGPPARSAEVVVVNTPPPAPRVTVLPERARGAQPLTCAVQEEPRDPDGDTVRYRIAWRRGKGSARLFADRPVLTAGTVKKGERWTCLARASDGEADSDEVSAVATVLNSAPAAPVIHLEPEVPVAGVDTLRCVIDTPAVDPDGDKVSYRVQWLKDGAQQDFASTSLEVPARLVVDQSLWQCAVEASDGADAAPLVRSNTVVVGRRAGSR